MLKNFHLLIARTWDLLHTSSPASPLLLNLQSLRIITLAGWRLCIRWTNSERSSVALQNQIPDSLRRCCFPQRPSQSPMAQPRYQGPEIFRSGSPHIVNLAQPSRDKRNKTFPSLDRCRTFFITSAFLDGFTSNFFESAPQLFTESRSVDWERHSANEASKFSIQITEFLDVIIRRA